ncbi:hypothetical protein VE03_00615 [Pseudogymnoascus sp. 23342-1-I1]|nr:hypothetical protein VE03_00615 [Pseudogymnoascus sp. 23342-1-I1]
MPKPRKTSPIAQNKKIKQLQTHLRSAMKRIHKLERRNLSLERMISPPRTFKYHSQIVRILEVKTFHRFSDKLLEFCLKPPILSLIFNPRNPKPLDHFSNIDFQVRLKSRPRPQITKPPELTEFHYFPDLPYEIRVPIWRLAVRAAPGRQVVLRVDPLEYSRPGARTWAQMSSSTTIPAFLHTCQLSRLLALGRWELCMAAYEGGVKKVYVDIENDSIFMPSLSALWHWQTKGDEREVGRIASQRNVYVVHQGRVRSWSDYEIVGIDGGSSDGSLH